MKPYIEQRNERIRKDYDRKFKQYKRNGVRNASSRAIEELVNQFSVFRLSYETIEEIVFNKNYGAAPEFGIQGRPDKDSPWTFLKTPSGELRKFSSKKKASKELKRLREIDKTAKATRNLRIEKILPEKIKPEETPNIDTATKSESVSAIGGELEVVAPS